MSEKTVTYRAVVYPAQCDAMGHMNTTYYVAAFDQAMWHMVAELGYRSSWIQDRLEGWADVKFVLDFKNEVRPGALIYVESTVAKVGRTSLVTKSGLAERSAA